MTDKNWLGFSDIQEKAIPQILTGGDYLVEAPTAGGKTEAVLFPILTNTARNKKRGVQILYVAPLRALLNDIELRAVAYAESCGLHAFKWHGDVSQRKKIEELSTPSQLLLTTPESLEAILLRKSQWPDFFSTLEAEIIDEAHNFSSGDRGGHLINVLQRLETCLKSKPQRVAMTATVGNADEMLMWLAGADRRTGTTITVAGSSITEEKKKDFRLYFFPQPDEDIDPEVDSLRPDISFLYGDVLPKNKSLVFAPSRKKTESIASAISRLNARRLVGITVKVRTHHSAVSKYYRESAESLIKVASEDGLDAIITTSTLELGIDIGQLDRVVQVGSLSSSSAFLQRVGRTGRRPQHVQVFTGICTEYDDLVLSAAVVHLGDKGVAERILYPHKAYHLLAHQLICLSLQNYGIQPRSAWEILSKSDCFSAITYADFQELVSHMVQEQYFRDVDGNLVVGEKTEKFFLGSNWRKLFAVFDSGPMYDVIDGKHHIGTLDASFVEALDVPFFFVLGGIEWKATKIRPSTKQVIVEKSIYGHAPKWSVYSGSDVPIETAKEVGRLVCGGDLPPYLGNEETREAFTAVQLKYHKIGWKAGVWKIFVSDAGKAQVWTFAGDRINRTLATILNQEKTGRAVASYERVKLDKGVTDATGLRSQLENVLNKIVNHDDSQVSELSRAICMQLRLIPFSKFAKCLPERIWKETQGERVFDLCGLLTEIRSNCLQFEVE